MFLRIRNRSSLCGFYWPKKYWKVAEAMEKSIRDLKVEFVHLCVWEREKKNSFEITVIIFRAYKKCKFPIKKEFLKGLLTNTSFFLDFRDRPENGEGKKGDVESTYVQE